MGGKRQGKEFAYEGAEMGLLGGRAGWNLLQETQPFREALYKTWQEMQGGNLPGGAFPQMYQAAKAPIESQYTMARRNVLEQVPKGGQLTEALTDVELGRAQGLQSVLADLYSDELMRMYSTAFGIPSTALQAMLGLSQQATGVGAGASQAAGGGYQTTCCFNFLEAEGEIYRTVRQYRDEHYSKDGYVGRGYLLTARYLVPLMHEVKLFKSLIRFIMTKPLKSYSQWYYGENRHGFIFWPIAKGWVNFWRLLGMGR